MAPLYRWRVYDATSPWKKRGGWRDLSWKMTEAEAADWARANGVERIERVEGSEEVRTDLDGRQGRA